MSIDAEITRLNLRVKTDKEDLLSKADTLAATSPYFEPFSNLLKKYFAVLDSTLTTRIGILHSDLNDETQISLYLTHIQYHLDHVHFFLTEVLNTHDKVSRGLYYLAEWFFGQAEELQKKVGYIFCLRRTLSTISFKEIIAARFRDLYPELYAKFDDDSFHFIFVPPALSQRECSVDWALVFHEFGHIIENERRALDSEFHGLPTLYFELVELGNKNHPDAIQKLHAIELLADYFALRRTGPVFIRRYYKNYGTLSTFFETSITHPPGNVRLSEAIGALKTEGSFHAACERIKKEAAQILGSQALQSPHKDPSAVAANKVRQRFEALLPLYRNEDYEMDLAGASESVLLEDLLDLKPVIGSPPFLFTLVTFCDAVVGDEKYQKLLADCLRLWLIAQKFPRVISSYSSAPPSKP